MQKLIILFIIILGLFSCSHNKQVDLSPCDCSDITFSHESGFYDSAFTLTLSTDCNDCTILYTLDGSEPSLENLNGYTYSYINSYQEKNLKFFQYIYMYIKQILTNDISNRPTFLNFINQLFKGKKNTRKIKTYIYKGSIKVDPNVITTRISNIPTSTWYFGTPKKIDKAFIINTKIINKNSNTQSMTYFIGKHMKQYNNLPIISIIGNENDFFSYNHGIFVPGKRYDSKKDSISGNFFMKGKKWEKKVHFSIFDSLNLKLSQEIGIRINGNMSRRIPHKSIKLYARKEYSASTIQYPFFKNSYIHKHLLLRTAGQDHSYTYFRDALVSLLMRNTYVHTEDYVPVNLFINGEYWGISNLRECFDEHYIKQNNGISKNNIKILKLQNDSHTIQKILLYDTLLNSSINDFQKIKKTIDVSSSIDKTIADVFFGNFDIHHKVWKDTTNPNSKWRWILWDMDVSFNSPWHSQYWSENLNNNNNYLSYIIPNYSLLGICNEKEVKVEFINRFALLMNSNLSTANMLYHIDSIANLIEPAMPKHIERWQHTYSIPSMEAWYENVEVLRTFARERHAYVYEHILEFFTLVGTTNITFYQNEGYTIFIEQEPLSKLAQLQRSSSLHTWTAKFFIGVPINISISEHAHKKQFKGWRVNGTIVSTKHTFEYTPTEDSVKIEAVF